MTTHIQRYDVFTNKFIGVQRVSDGVEIPKAPGNADWDRFIVLNAADPAPLNLSDIPAPVPPVPAEVLNTKRALALSSLLTRDDETALAVRAMFSAVVFLVNNRLETLGQKRILQEEIIDYITANPLLGDPRKPEDKPATPKKSATSATKTKR